MSDTEKGATTGGKAGGGWTDKERLVYLLALIEQTGMKLDIKNTPRPNNRSEIACQRMIDRLKNTLKDDLENLKSGQPIGDSTPKKRGPAKAAGENGTTPKSTPKRKKAQADGDAADDKGSPKKKGRPKKAANDEGGWEVKAEIKAEVKDEQVDEEEI